MGKQHKARQPRLERPPARLDLRLDLMLYSSMTAPFVDMTVKGWLWYQGENNMGGTKGNSAASVGYACHQKALVEGWRRVW